MKNHQTKRRPHRRNSDSDYTFPVAITSIIRCAYHRAGDVRYGLRVWQIASYAFPGLFPRSESSAMTGLHTYVHMPTRLA